MLTLKTQKRKLTAYQAQLSASVALDTATAAALARAGQRERALLVLRKRSESNRVLAHTDGWLLQLEEALQQLDSHARTAQLLAALRSGADVIKALSSQTTLADVEALMGDSAEAAEAQRSLAAALGGGEAAEAAEAAEEELAALMQQMGESEAATLPAVPARRPAVAVAQAEAQPTAAEAPSSAEPRPLRTLVSEPLPA